MDIAELETKKDKELSVIGTILIGYRKVVEEKQIVNETDLENAGETLKKVKDYRKGIEYTRTTLVKPFNDAIRTFNSEFKKPVTAADEIIKIISDKILVFQREQKRKAEEEEHKRREEIQKKLEAEKQNKIEEAAETNDEEKLKEAEKIEEKQTALTERPVEIKQTVRSKSATTSIRKRWAYRIIDINKLSRSFMIENDKKIKDSIRNGVRQIDGLEIYQEESVDSR